MRLFSLLLLTLACLCTLCSCANRDVEARLLELERLAGVSYDERQGLDAALASLEQRVRYLEQAEEAASSSRRDSARKASPVYSPKVAHATDPDSSQVVPQIVASLTQDGSEGPRPSVGRPVSAQPAQAKAQPANKAAYDAALALYDRGDYERSFAAFGEFMRQSPGSSLMPNAMYWQGECLYSRKQYDKSIMLFKDVVARYPAHAKAAAALLKAGYSYERLGDMGNARFYWQILLDDYPDSAPARLARPRMARK